ncbi:MAG: acylneuraminate cytidylyltransferase, partial [Rhizorhabdus sp.]|nr:acylneuraminate cytidylyltransferase [Rhizorhabdus sp.]
FGDRPDGLVGIKLQQLVACKRIDEIVLSTNDEAVIAIGEQWLDRAEGRLRIDRRPDHLCASSTSTDEVIAYVPTIIPEGDVVWTHVTSPFFDSDDYVDAIDIYEAALNAGTHDSLMGVTKMHGFIWNDQGPITYDRAVEKWPRTQTLTPLFEVNSAIFIAPISVYKDQADRIGQTPLLHDVGKAKTVDIDWEEDFEIAQSLWNMRAAKG